MRHKHHEGAMSLAGWAITIAPVACIAGQAAIAAVKRRKTTRIK